MKINRTYSIDVWIARELQNKSNQSRFVNDAIREKLDRTTHDSIGFAPIRQLMAAITAREDCDPFIKKVLLQNLSRK
jgi:hypothetical protein